MKRDLSSDNPYPDATLAIRGYRERLTPKSRFKVIEIDFTADPAKDNPVWLAEQYRLLGENMVRREVLRDWTVAAGDAFFPEYSSYGGRPTYEFKCRGLLPTFVFRGWDFGERKPALVWGQVSTRLPHRVYIQRELVPFGLSTYGLADICKFLSGQLPYDEMDIASRSYYDSLLAAHEILPGPWYPDGTHFLDYSGHEVFKSSATVKDGDPRSDYEILASKGIQLQANWVQVTARVKVMRRLLQLQRDGKPLIMIDENCNMVHGMLAGGLGYPKATEANPSPVKPREDAKGFHDIWDATSYPCEQLISLVEDPKPQTRVARVLDTLREEEAEPVDLWIYKEKE